jgi:hypothetical protein
MTALSMTRTRRLITQIRWSAVAWGRAVLKRCAIWRGEVKTAKTAASARFELLQAFNGVFREKARASGCTPLDLLKLLYAEATDIETAVLDVLVHRTNGDIRTGSDALGLLYAEATESEAVVLDAVTKRTGLIWVCPICGRHNTTWPYSFLTDMTSVMKRVAVCEDRDCQGEKEEEEPNEMTLESHSDRLRRLQGTILRLKDELGIPFENTLHGLRGMWCEFCGASGLDEPSNGEASGAADAPSDDEPGRHGRIPGATRRVPPRRTGPQGIHPHAR